MVLVWVLRRPAWRQGSVGTAARRDMSATQQRC